VEVAEAGPGACTFDLPPTNIADVGFKAARKSVLTQSVVFVPAVLRTGHHH
jgi:hypothetical protein